jgi:extracellular elastinolytic metalloproteinase
MYVKSYLKPFQPASAQIKEVPRELTSDILSPSLALSSFAKHLNIEHEPFVHEQVFSFMPLTFKSAVYSIDAPFVLAPVPAFLSYIQSSDDALLLVWDLEVEMENNWFHAHVDAVSGEIIMKIDWVAGVSNLSNNIDSKYNVFPLGTNDPNQGKRNLVKNPENALASPQGWINGNTTQGNNAFAQENEAGRGQWKNNHRPEGTGKEVFDFVFDRSYFHSFSNRLVWNRRSTLMLPSLICSTG